MQVGGEGDDRGRERTGWWDGITDTVDMSLSELWEMVRTGKPGVLHSLGVVEKGGGRQLSIRWFASLVPLARKSQTD